MAKCVIFYFSGTGNTEFVAKAFSEAFISENISSEIRALDDPICDFNVADCDYVGLGYPVYAFSLPALIWREAVKIPPALPNQKAFVFTTAGGTGMGALKTGVNLIASRRYKVLRSSEIIMPSNYTISPMNKKYELSADEVDKIFEKAAKRVGETVRQILEGKSGFDNKFPFFGGIISWLGKFAAPFLNTTAKRFYISEKCNSCGLCAKSCPTANIEMSGGKPIFLDKCIACCRCYNICPQKAIIHPSVPDNPYRYTAPGYKPPMVNP